MPKNANCENFIYVISLTPASIGCFALRCLSWDYPHWEGNVTGAENDLVVDSSVATKLVTRVAVGVNSPYVESLRTSSCRLAV